MLVDFIGCSRGSVLVDFLGCSWMISVGGFPGLFLGDQCWWISLVVPGGSVLVDFLGCSWMISVGGFPGISMHVRPNKHIKP